MKIWTSALVVIILLLLYLLTSCVSVRKSQIDQESAYHNGRQSVIWKISDWMQDDDLTVDEVHRLVEGLKSGEYIWSDYFLLTYFPPKETAEPFSWNSPPHTFKDPFKPMQQKERAP